MNRRLRKGTAALAILCLLSMIVPASLAASSTSGNISRLYGTDRIGTALNITDAGWTKAATAIVAPSDQSNLVDALAASPLAGQENAPILLTPKTKLDNGVKNKLISLEVKKVYVIGAISDVVRNEIATIPGISVETLKGSNRLETVAQINSKLVNPNGTFVVGYNALPDALSVGSFAAANRYAIILADASGAIPSGQRELGSKTYLIGGPTLTKNISGATRLSGANRYETNAEIVKALAYSFDKVYVANGNNAHLVDSLVAAPLAGQSKSPVLLTDGSAVAALNNIQKDLKSDSKIIGLGGPTIVTDSVLSKVAGSGPTVDTSALKATAATILNAKQFKVTFNKEVELVSAEKLTSYSVVGPGLSGFQLAGINDRASDVSVAVCQADKKSVVVTLDVRGAADGARDYCFTNNEEYNITVSKVRDTAGKPMESQTFSNVLFADKSIPSFDKVEVLGPQVLKLLFSEPMDVFSSNFTPSRDITIDGRSSVSFDITGVPQDNAVILALGASLSAGSHTVRVQNLPDYVGYGVPRTDIEFTVAKQTALPTFSIRLAEAKRLVLAFSAPVKNVGNSANEIVLGNNLLTTKMGVVSPLDPLRVGGEDYAVLWEIRLSEGYELNGTQVSVTVNNKASRAVDRILDLWGNEFSSATKTAPISATSSDIDIVSVQAKTSSRLVVKFNQNVNRGDAEDRNNYTLYTANGRLYSSNNNTDAQGHPLNSTNITYNTSTYEATLDFAQSLVDQEYTLRVSNVRDTSGKAMAPINYNFSMRNSGGLQLTSAVLDQAQGTLTLTFSNEVNRSTTNDRSARNAENYQINNTPLTNKDIMAQANGATVTLMGSSVKNSAGKTITADIIDIDGSAMNPRYNSIRIIEAGSKAEEDLVKQAFQKITLTKVDLENGRNELTLITRYPVKTLDKTANIRIFGSRVTEWYLGDSVAIEENDGSKYFGTEVFVRVAGLGDEPAFDTDVANGKLRNFDPAGDGELSKSAPLQFTAGAMTFTNGLQTPSLTIPVGDVIIEDKAPPRMVGATYSRNSDGVVDTVEIRYSEKLDRNTLTRLSGHSSLYQITYNNDRTAEARSAYSINDYTIRVIVETSGISSTAGAPKLITQTCNVTDANNNRCTEKATLELK